MTQQANGASASKNKHENKTLAGLKRFGLKLYKLSISIRLAVFIILGIAVISAIGTIYESKYDAEVAQKLIYFSWPMIFFLSLLCFQLIMILVDRWPWKPRHIGFILAHFGIIMTLLGALLTHEYGLDGSMYLQIGEESKFVRIRDRELNLYSSFDGVNFTSIMSKNADFLKDPLKKPLVIDIAGDPLEITEYHHFAFREDQMIASDYDVDGAAVRFQLHNDRVNQVQWILQDGMRKEKKIDLGPAQVVITSNKEYTPAADHELVFFVSPERTITSEVFIKGQKSQEHKIKEGESFPISFGKMIFDLKILRVLPKARERVTYIPSETSSPKATSALKLKFKGEDLWLGLNNVLRLYTENQVYFLTYSQKRIEVEPIKLLDFKVGHYEGTKRAASYESEVEVRGKKYIISMNEPLKDENLTFYQASYDQDPQGRPIASILSVNSDPGRGLKYVGCFLIVFGSILLFVMRKGKIRFFRGKA